MLSVLQLILQVLQMWSKLVSQVYAHGAQMQELTRVLLAYQSVLHRVVCFSWSSNTQWYPIR